MRSYLRPVRSLIPVAAAASFWLLPVLRACIYSLTSLSFFMDSLLGFCELRVILGPQAGVRLACGPVSWQREQRTNTVLLSLRSTTPAESSGKSNLSAGVYSN